MATTFNVFSLGKHKELDTREGNSVSEGSSKLLGHTFGGEKAPLHDNIQSMSPGSTGFQRGYDDVYDQSNCPSETFRINDGAEQTFDGLVVYRATLTYSDGTQAKISAVIFQDTHGNTYLAPEHRANSDQDALEAKPIVSLELNAIDTDIKISGLFGDREVGNYMVCFAQGTRLETPSGLVPIEELNVGDVVQTLDNGPRAIRWIGSRTVPATDAMRPVRIRIGALGNGLPHRELNVSQQHRLLTYSKVAERMFGQKQILAAATKLVGLPGITFAPRRAAITYWHILCDRHEIVWANGAPAETLFAGKQACAALGSPTVKNIIAQCPDLAPRFKSDVAARQLPTPREQKNLVKRLIKNGKHVLEPEFSPHERSTLAMAT